MLQGQQHLDGLRKVATLQLLLVCVHSCLPCALSLQPAARTTVQLQPC